MHSARLGDSDNNVTIVDAIRGAETSKIPLFLGSDGAMAKAISAYDWSSTPLGPIDLWPTELCTAAGIMLQAGYPAALWWGPQRTAIYNDDYVAVLGERSPALGRGFADVWPDLAETIGVLFDEIFITGRGVSGFDERIDVVRHGHFVECYWNYSFTPIVDAQGQVLGIINSALETTRAVLGHRSDTLLLDLDNRLNASDDIDAMIDAALALIGEHLGGKRTGYAEITDETLDIRRCWTSGPMPNINGRYPLGTFGKISDELKSGKTVRIEDSRTDPRTSAPEIIARYDRVALRSGIVVPLIDRGRYFGGVFLQDDIPRRWSDNETALAEVATARLWQALVRARAEAGLRESEQRFRLIFEQANDIIFTADIDQCITASNPAASRALGYETAQIVGRSIADFVSPPDFTQTTSMLNQKLQQGGHTRHEVSVIGRDGNMMRWENDSTLVVDADKRPIGLLSISRDVTERRAFEERRELLIRELNHRVKNTLALVQAIAHQSFRPDADGPSAQDNFMARLRTLASAHDLLTREQWEGVTLAELVRAATGVLDTTRIDAAGDALVITPKSAVALAMSLHELGTNAVKYGALSTQQGRIEIRWTLSDDRLHLDWREYDGPPVSTPERRGFGIKMIERALASDLGARVSVEFASDGVHCSIDAPRKGNVT